MQISHYLPHSGDVIEPLQTEPEAFGPRFAITLSSQEPSKAGNYLSQNGRASPPLRCCQSRVVRYFLCVQQKIWDMFSILRGIFWKS